MAPSSTHEPAIVASLARGVHGGPQQKTSRARGEVCGVARCRVLLSRPDGGAAQHGLTQRPMPSPHITYWRKTIKPWSRLGQESIQKLEPPFKARALRVLGLKLGCLNDGHRCRCKVTQICWFLRHATERIASGLTSPSVHADIRWHRSFIWTWRASSTRWRTAPAALQI